MVTITLVNPGGMRVIINSNGYPMCAKCGRRVEMLSEEADQVLDRVIFRAHCHGEVERIVIYAKEIAGKVDPSLGVAFAETKQLPP